MKQVSDPASTPVPPADLWVRRVGALSDPIRNRLLMVLERHELTVGEMCETFEMPQSTLSRQLKTLAEADWVVVRRDGTRRLYRVAGDRLDEEARSLWSLARSSLAADATVAADLRRAAEVLRERRRRSRAYFDATAERWDRVRDELYGSGVHLAAALALVPGRPVVGDLGCGSGALAAALAPFARRVIAVDESEAMLASTRRRVDGLDNVEVRGGSLEALPIDDGRLDVATLMLVLHHVTDPAAVVREVGRALRPGGRLAIVDMLPHDREAFRESMGHVWSGFDVATVREWAEGAGLGVEAIRELAPDPEAKGPPLFVATLLRPTDGTKE